jgi:hypothetical protein
MDAGQMELKTNAQRAEPVRNRLDSARRARKPIRFNSEGPETGSVRLGRKTNRLEVFEPVRYPYRQLLFWWVPEDGLAQPQEDLPESIAIHSGANGV